MVSTIHSFAWELIRHYTTDIKQYLCETLNKEIQKLEEEKSKGRIGTKASLDRNRKIENKKIRLSALENIQKFTYNPNGDNIDEDSLSHTEVISISAFFLENKPLFQKVLVQKFPILLVDESQDTKKELINALFLVQQKNNKTFSLGLFGDTMQRIYTDGKEDLGVNLPNDWYKPEKRLNHRCPKRVISLINKIRSDVDGIKQLPRTDKEEGIVRLFIIPSHTPKKTLIEDAIKKKMSEISRDESWRDIDDKSVKVLTLEHHMAAKRMGFEDLFSSLYKVERYRTGILDGTLPGIRLFTQYILPLIEAKNNRDDFAISRIIRQHSPIFKKENFKLQNKQTEVIKNANAAVKSLFSLWENNSDPLLIDILNNIAKSKLFAIPDNLKIIAQRTDKGATIIDDSDKDVDESISAWEKALSTTFENIVKYNDYISNKSMFGTHQGVKGLQFERVLAILDDEEAKGFLFSYEKLFGAKASSETDRKNITEGKETSIDRTRRLFYVICSRAVKSLAIVAYTNDVDAVKNTVLANNWFMSDEILFLDSLKVGD